MAKTGNQFKFGQSDLFPREQFRDIYGATVGAKLQGLRSDRRRERRDFQRQKANFSSLANQFKNRLGEQRTAREDLRDRGIERVAENRAAFDDRTAANLEFLSDIFGHGTEDTTVDSATVDRGVQAEFGSSEAAMARALEQQQRADEQSAAERMGIASAQEAQARSQAFNEYLSRVRAIGSEIEQVKRSRPLFAQQIREQLENRGIAMEELGLAKTASDQAQQQIDMRREQAAMDNAFRLQQIKAQAKNDQHTIRKAWGETVSGIVQGGSHTIKEVVPTYNDLGEQDGVKSVERTVTFPGPTTKKAAIDQAVARGVNPSFARMSVNRLWSARNTEAKAQRDALIKKVWNEFLSFGS